MSNDFCSYARFIKSNGRCPATVKICPSYKRGKCLKKEGDSNGKKNEASKRKKRPGPTC